MNKQLNLSAKKYNFLQKLQINSFVDAIDQSRWKVAQIVEFKNIGHKHTIRLHFDGFPNNWDQYFDLPASTKLAPFRRFTLPYTGPIELHRTIHRPNPSLNFEEPLANLRKLCKQDKQKLKPDFIIQFYRGTLFILMDTLLTMPYKVKQEQQVQIQKFFEAYIEAGIHILKYSLEKINEISKQNITQPNVIYVNPIYSLISSIPEILFNFNSLVSSRQKRIKFFGQSQIQIQQYRKRYRAYLKSKQIVQICRSILEYQNPPYRGFSWNIKKQSLTLLAGLEQQCQFPKIGDNRQIPEALDILPYLKTKQVFSQQFIENIHIDLVMTLLMSGNFQGKLKSLSELKKFCENTFIYKKQILKQKILSPQLLNALTDNATFNGQIFKRSLPLFQAAAKYDLITDQILKRILNLHKDKHELEVKSYYSTLADFGQILNQKKTIQLFQEIKNFAITIDTINLIKNYTQNVIKRHPYFKKKYMEPQTGFGLVYLWQIIKQNNSYEIVNAAILAFAALSSDCYYRQIIEKYIIQCFSNIKASKNVQSSLKIIHFCLNKNKDIVSIIQTIDKQFSIIDTVIKSLIQAQQISSTTIQSIFEFIQQVNQVARKKITVNHIRDLWKLKQCQKSLLKFMRKSASFKMQKQKSHEKIANKKLSQLQIHQIVSKIFLNKPLMDNYLNCDEQLYKTIDELLISYNHRNKYIQYNFKHSIKCISTHQLFGLELYLQIASNCKDQIIVNKCLKRFIQYYLRPFGSKSTNSNKNDKVGLWLLCADKLTKYFEQNPKKYSAYAILFEEIKGRMLSINILDPTQATFTVQIKGTNNRKIITAPHCYSLWKVRQIIDQEFKLNKTNFGMYMVDQKVSFEMDREEDFSALFLNASRDPTDIAVIVTQAKESHPHFVAIEEFKANFTNIYAQKIYQSLNLIKNLDIQLIALNLLLELPLIKNIQSRALKLQLGAQLSWDQILDPECRTRLSYQIHILNKVKQSGTKWIMDFIKKGGVEHMQKILRQRSSNKVSLAAKDYQFLIQLLQFFNQVIQFYRMHQTNLPFNEASIIQIMRFSNQQKTNISLIKQQVFLEYFYLTFNTLKEIASYYPHMEVKKILSNPHIEQVLQFLLFTQKKADIQSRFPQNIYVIFQKSNCDKLLSNICQHFLSNLIIKPNMKYCCRVFFDILVLIFDNNFVTDSLFQKVLQFIKNVRFAQICVYQEKQNSQNELIQGWLRIYKCLLLKSISNLNFKFITQPPQNFADFIISNGLFGQQHRFQHDRSRQQAFEILTNISCKNYVMEKLGNQILPIITKGFWRRQNQWFVKSFKKRQKDTKVGLKNLAATCYINSLLQQLYYIKQFSEPLLDIDTKLIEVKQNIAYEVQKIFAYLKYSNREVFTTQTLCQNFIVDGQPIDPRIQMDIDQFFHTLMDKLQYNLMKIKKQNIIDDIFKGEYSNLIVGQQCQHKSERIQNFLSMRLDIIKKNSLTEALSEFIKGQVLQGQNAYHCQKCDKKIKAVKRVCIKSLPDVLILTLKRFQFDFDKMEKFKLNSYCQFQQQLNMAPYTRQFLYEGEEKLSPEEYIYKLKGVVIHYGVSQAGHYTSYIRIQNGEWKYFDDDKISNFNLKQLGKQCFGGPDDNPYSQNSQKLKNAYLLIYERIKRNKISKINSNPPIKAEVDAENLNNKQIKIMFDSNLQNFFDNNSFSLSKTYLLYVHLVSLRSQNRVKLYKKCYENCITIFQANPHLIQWYLQQFSQNLIKQLLIFTFFEASNFVASLLVYCIGKCFNVDFIKRCMKCIDRKNMVPLSKIFVAASWNAKYFKVLTEYSFPEKIYRIIKQDKISNQAGLSKISSSRSEFGQPFQTFYQKKDTRNSIELIQCIQAFKIKGFLKQDVLPFASRAKKPAIQISIAKFFVSKIKDQQALTNLANQFILPYLNKFQPKFQQEYIFKFAIILTNKLAENKDLPSIEKVVAEIYFISIKQNLNGYKAMRLLLQGLFSICFNNDKVREQFINILNQKDNKKYIKLIKDWMKQADKFEYNIKQDRIGYWRKLTRNPYSVLQRLQLDIKVSSQKYLSLFNSLLQKHKIDFTDIYSPSIKKGEKISIFEYLEYNYEVVDKFGLILQIKNDGGDKFVLEDDVYPQRSV